MFIIEGSFAKVVALIAGIKVDRFSRQTLRANIANMRAMLNMRANIVGLT